MVWTERLNGFIDLKCFDVWDAGQLAGCLPAQRFWVLSPVLYKLGMVVDTRNTNTGEVEAMDQGFKIICDCKVSSGLAWDTQKPVSKTKQNIQNKKSQR